MSVRLLLISFVAAVRSKSGTLCLIHAVVIAGLKKDIPGSFDTSNVFNTSVPFHGCTFFVFMQPSATWPEPFEVAPWLAKPTPLVPPATA